ncbi:MAG: hypothetical protein ABR553_00355 [Gammaproteobacteria bacterium]
MAPGDRAGTVLVGLIFGALVALLGGLSLSSTPAPVWRHLLFAVGVMPLILGAMLYFVPVLTRSRAVRGALLLPLAALVLGLGVVISLSMRPHWLPGLAALGVLIVVLEMAWMWRRRQHSLGPAHAGVDWYLAALAALTFALALVASRAIWPEHWAATRLMHLHLNLLGFLGLTAIGTLRVLLPTVLGVHDPAALSYLRRQLPYAAFGALAIGVGAAYAPPLALLGALAWAWPSLSLLRALRRDSTGRAVPQGAGLALSAAVLGWLLVLAAGVAHGLDVLSADTVLALLLFLFLLPLVTGATSYLLPVWRWPGAASAAHAQMRDRLTANSGLRVAAFWLSALLSVAGAAYAAVPAMFALLAYLAQVLLAFVRVGSASGR